MLRILLFSCFVALAYAQCGCAPSMISDENGLPKPDPETGLYEGDMRLTSNNFLEMLGLRNTMRNLWTNRVVYYTIVSGSETQITSALASLQSALSNCVRFEKRTTQSNYVEVSSPGGAGCWSHVGMIGGKQRLVVGPMCINVGTIQHEFIHALGFYHEQSRSDRDNHITINWANISSTTCAEFYKGGILASGFPAYDVKSLMHFGSGEYSCNGKQTITTKTGGTVGGSTTFTSLDVAKIRRLYGC